MQWSIFIANYFILRGYVIEAGIALAYQSSQFHDQWSEMTHSFNSTKWDVALATDNNGANIGNANWLTN